MKQANLNTRARDMLHALQAQRTPSEGSAPPLHLLVDGSYTNRKILKELPANTTLIGRIRKDAHLNHLPQSPSPKGRPRVYGEDAPTPEQLRKDPSVPWSKSALMPQVNDARFASRPSPRCDGEQQETTQPADGGHRSGSVPKRLSSKRLYRQPAYLICTDPTYHRADRSRVHLAMGHRGQSPR